jgi:uncharacterized protein
VSAPYPGRYRAPAWLPGAHAQTLYAALLAPTPRVRYRRERWETPDGDFVDVDWVANESSRNALTQHARAASDTPLLALFHGLEGCSASPYAHALMAEVQAAGWRGAVMHFRGCSGEVNQRPRAYHSGDSVELHWMLCRLAAAADGPLFAVGVSLGGNVLLKWLGEQGAAAHSLVAAAAAVSAPVDLMAAGDALARGFNMIYTRAFLRTLRRKSAAMLERHPGLFDAERVRAARTLREFDDAVTAPLHGFAGTDDYWRRASSKPWLSSIEVPTLIINARNDPFMPSAALPDLSDLADAVTAEFPDEGGHVGFVSGPFPGRLHWLPRRIVGYFGSLSRAATARAADPRHAPCYHRSHIASTGPT